MIIVRAIMCLTGLSDDVFDSYLKKFPQGLLKHSVLRTRSLVQTASDCVLDCSSEETLSDDV